jgi:hypothetical protein
MDVRCSGCMTITTVFSHATNVRAPAARGARRCRAPVRQRDAEL